MIARIVPYSEVFVQVTLTLDEAAVISDILGSLRAQKDAAMQKPIQELQAALEESLDKAAEYKTRKGV